MNKDERVTPFIRALEFPNYEAANKHLADNGCPIVKESPGSEALYFRYPFGITIDIIEKASSARPGW